MYSDIDAGTTERFFTVVNREDGIAITTGLVNYYLKAKSGDNKGTWWDDATKAWVSTETANEMTHDADGHWEIDLTESPFINNIRFLEYVKETTGLHVPDSRHLQAKFGIIVDSDGQISSNNVSCDVDAIISAMIKALANVQLEKERVVLGGCEREVKKNFLLPIPKC